MPTRGASTYHHPLTTSIRPNSVKQFTLEFPCASCGFLCVSDEWIQWLLAGEIPCMTVTVDQKSSLAESPVQFDPLRKESCPLVSMLRQLTLFHPSCGLQFDRWQPDGALFYPHRLSFLVQHLFVSFVTNISTHSLSFITLITVSKHPLLSRSTFFS